MNFLRRFWQRLTCHHSFTWQRNYHGDLINLSGGMRSLWRCEHCGKYQERKELGCPWVWPQQGLPGVMVLDGTRPLAEVVAAILTPPVRQVVTMDV